MQTLGVCESSKCHRKTRKFFCFEKKKEICFSKLAHFGVKRERAAGLSKQINLLVFYVAKKRSDLKMEIKLRVSFSIGP